MRVFSPLLVVIEASVCFGPLLLLLCLGVLFSPFWIAGLALDPLVTAEPTPTSDFVFPLLMVFLGILGTVALICVVFELVTDKRLFSTRVRKAVVAPGILAVLMFNWPWIPTLLAGEMTLEAWWPLLIYFVMPTAGSIHLLWLSSRTFAATKRELAL